MSIDNVNDISPRVQYTASASQTVFDYPFPIFVAADLTVLVDGVVVSNYTVAGAGADAGGTITFTSGLTVGSIVTIYRQTAIARTSDYEVGARFSSATVNDDLDTLIVIAQEIDSRVDRSIKTAITDMTTEADLTLPVVADRLGKYMYFDATGKVAASSGTGADAGLRTDLASGASAAAILVNSTGLRYLQTTAESAASITPSTYYWPPGDIRRYGAVGDDSTDNTTAISNAILECAQRGDPVYVPHGIFRAGECALASGVRIYGDGWNSCLKLKNSGNARVLATTNGAVYIDDVLIESLQIDCNKLNNTSGGGIIINGRRNVVRNCYVHDAVNTGIQFGASAGIANTPLSGQLLIIGNLLRNCGKSNAWGQLAVTHGKGLTIAHNTIVCDDAQSDYGIDAEPNVGNYMEDIVIANNVIRGGNIQVDGGPLAGSNVASGIVVASNRVDARGRYKPFEKTAMAPLWFRQIKDFAITGNVCQGHATSNMGGIVFEDAGMTTTYSAEAGVVKGNFFRSTVATARDGYCRIVKDVVFDGNQWQGSSSGNSIEFSGAGVNVRGIGNIINNNGAGYAVNIGAGTNIVFDASNSLTGLVSVGGTACKVARDDLYGSATWNIGSTLTQVSVSTQVTVTGASRTKGQYVKSVVLTTLPQGWALTASITNTDEVTVVATNVTGSTADPASGTVSVTLGRETLS